MKNWQNQDIGVTNNLFNFFFKFTQSSFFHIYEMQISGKLGMTLSRNVPFHLMSGVLSFIKSVCFERYALELFKFMHFLKCPKILFGADQ